MSFNTKNLKYIKVDGVDVHEAEVGSDKMYSSGVRQTPRPNNVPVFRDNGYQIEIDKTNGVTDGIYIDNPQNVSMLSDVDVSFDVEIDISTVSATTAIFKQGTFNNASTGLFQIDIGTTGIVRCFTSGVSNTNTATANFFGLSGNRINASFKNLEFTVNGVLVSTFTDIALDLSSSFDPSYGVNVSESTIFNNLKYQGGEFDLSTFEGSTITADNGDTATITTSHVDGDSYIERDMVQKKSFALELESSNRDYGIIEQSEKVYDVPSTGTFEFGLTFDVPSVFPACGLIGYLSFGNSGGYSYGLFNDGNSLYFNTGGNTNLKLSGFRNTYKGQTVTVKCGYYDVSPTTRIYVNDVLAASSDVSPRPTSALPSNYNFFLGAYGQINGGTTPLSTLHYTGKIYDFFVDDGTFLLREGLGNELIGSDGTVATVETSHVDGMRRINYGTWKYNGGYQLEFDGSNTDYARLDSDYSMAVGDSIKFDFTMLVSDSYPLGVYTTSDQHIRVLTTDIRIKVVAGNTIIFPTTNTVGERMQIEIIRTATNYEILKNGVSLGTQSSSNQLMINAINSRSVNTSFRKDIIIHGFQLGSNNPVNFREVTGSDINDDLGVKVGGILTSHVDGSTYIDTLWKKDKVKWIDYN